jgi:carboxyl-terminal processing protease
MGVATLLLLVYPFGDRGKHFGASEVRAKVDRGGVHDLSRARLLTKVTGQLRSHYVDPDRIEPKRMIVAALREIQALVPEVRVLVDERRDGTPRSVNVWVANDQARFGLERVGDLFELGWKLSDVFEFLQRHLPPSTDLADVEYAAVNGMLSTLDPHSVLLTPQTYREMQLGTQGRFGGLGIVISVRDGSLTVMSVMAKTPAARAGLQSADKIVQIGEESTVNMPLNDAVNRLRGEAGTQVTIWVVRPGWNEPRSFAITREEIRIQAVEHESLGDGVGYVKIARFQGNTDDELGEALAELGKSPDGFKGLVLDLRENPGGLLDQAIRVSDRFLADGTIVSTVREGVRQREERHATRAETHTDLPLIVLINRGSASASEIVAGALKHNDRALIVGDTSFGKGSVQVIYQIDDAALKLTIAQYLTPGDISIQSVGIAPDVEIQTLHATREHVSLAPDQMERRGEAGLDKHLEHRSATKEKSSISLRLLHKKAAASSDGSSEKPNSEKSSKSGEDAGAQDTDAGAQDTPEGQEASKADPDIFKADELTELAKSLLKAGSHSNRATALLWATPVLAARQVAEELALAERLQELGVDWTQGENPRRLAADVSLEILDTDGKPVRRAVAGQKVRLKASVKVRGKRGIWRLHAYLRSEIGILNGREFVFGRIGPGETRSWEVEMELPKSLEMQADKLTLELWSGGEKTDIKTHHAFEVGALALPRFATSVRVEDDEGNRDGLIQRGESIRLAVDVENLGPGAAQNVLVTLKNESGEQVYIRSGRDRIGELALNGTSTSYFTLDIRSGLASQDVQLQLTVVDQTLRTWMQQDVSLPVFPNEFPTGKDATGWVRAGDKAVPVHAGAHEDSLRVGALKAGSLVGIRRKAGDWALVALSGSEDQEIQGWIQDSDLEHPQGGAATGEAFEPAPRRSPPALELVTTTLSEGDLSTREATFELTGTARYASSERGRRYVYVFRGDDKVFFQAGAPGAAARELAFETEIPLEPGRNVLSVIARQGERDVTRRSVVIYRDAKGEEK